MHNSVFCIETARYLSKEGEKSQSKKTLPSNSIIVSCIATPGLVSLTSSPAQTNQQINGVIPQDNQELYLFLELLSKSNLIIELGSSGSTTYNLNKTQFEKIKILAPTVENREHLNNTLKPLFNIIKQKSYENINLTRVRNELLPKLISGEISVSELSEVVE